MNRPEWRTIVGPAVVAVICLVAILLDSWLLRGMLEFPGDKAPILGAIDRHTGMVFLYFAGGISATIMLIVKVAVLAKRVGQTTTNATNTNEAKLADLQRRQRLLVDEAVDVICVVDIEGKFVWISSSCLSAWGYAPNELIGKPLTTVLRGDGESHSVLGTISGAAKSIDKVTFEGDLTTKSGATIAISWTGHWSATEGGLFSIVHDISEQKRAEREARDQAERLERLLAAERELERMKQDFVAMVTHDLRSPVTSIQGLLTLMQTGVIGTLNDEGKSVAQRVEKECGRLLRLLNDLLDLERIESDQFQLDLADVNVSSAVKDAVENVRSLAKDKGVTIETQLADVVCRGDEQRLAQVLINLVSNAVKYSPAGSVVRVAAEKRKGDVRLSVVDRGPGIPLEKQQKIFDKFVLVDKEAKKQGGIGLGLAICKAIVSQHGGEIGVSSKLGEGSEFWFTIPVAVVGTKSE